MPERRGQTDNRKRRREVKVDASGREINPYIPNYIAKAPWYHSEENKGSANDNANDNDEAIAGDYLSHQRLDPSKPIESFADARPGQGIVDSVSIVEKTKEPELYDTSIYKKVRIFPSDACSNCGSMAHIRKECLEKPRRVTAKSLMIVIDEKKEKLKNIADWDSKRDRWNGYDVEKDWDDQAKHWEERDQAVSKKPKLKDIGEQEEKDEEDYDEDEAAEMMELGLLPAASAQQNDEKIINIMEKPDKMPVRSREDRPVYLQNLGGEVTYNPKTRTDRSAANGYINDRNQFVRHLNGEAEEHARLKTFAWDQNKDYQVGAGNGEHLDHLNKHLEASPTAALLEMKKREEEKQKLKEARDLKKAALLAKYGDGITKPATATATAGSAVKPDPITISATASPARAKISTTEEKKTKFSEDVLVNGHSSVWGSYWNEGKWGYKCCQQTVKDTPCSK